jgi:hypothetical protein
MRALTPIHADGSLVLSLDQNKRWLYTNGKKWGFRHAQGFYCHRRDIERFRRELGFHIPKVLLGYKITFEVHNAKGSYSTWVYDPKQRQRMMPTDPLVFVSLARLVWTKDAEHVPRPQG